MNNRDVLIGIQWQRFIDWCAERGYKPCYGNVLRAYVVMGVNDDIR